MSRILGQEKLLTNIDSLIYKNKFPRFSILCGGRGAGKLIISKYIANKLAATFVLIEPRIDAVRECIKLAYEQNEPTLYYIPNTDKMSSGAKNALLKVTEEPPQKAYFIMGVKDKQNILSTLISRGAVFEINAYTQQCLQEYFSMEKLDKCITPIINYCQTPGELKLFSQQHVNGQELKSLCQKVVQHIANASASNALKISQSLRYKSAEEEPEKFDILLFMHGVSCELFEQIFIPNTATENKKVYSKAIVLTSTHEQQLNITGINKLAVIDQWILNLRKILMEVK